MTKLKKITPINELLQVMAKLRSPTGCPWDREQDHKTLRWHAVEEVYELMDAIEAGDDAEMAEELGDVLLQVVFHAQMASERGAFDFDAVAQHITEKLIRRHPHVFGDSKAKSIAAIWTQWEQIKKSEKAGTRHERPSVLDGIPRHLPALLRSEKLIKKARKGGLIATAKTGKKIHLNRAALAKQLFFLAEYAQQQGWSAEQLLLSQAKQQEKLWRRSEKKALAKTRAAADIQRRIK